MFLCGIKEFIWPFDGKRTTRAVDGENLETEHGNTPSTNDRCWYAATVAEGLSRGVHELRFRGGCSTAALFL